VERLALEGQRGPWSFGAWWSPARRASWPAWGFPGAGEAASGGAAFQRFGASASRAVVLSPRALVRVEAAAMGGHGLDRFSRFSFDAFDNRLRGYPSAGLRFDRGAVLRTAGTWNVAPGIRLDAFADTAFARDPGFGTGFLRYSGVGAGLEAPLPWRMLLSAEWGFGFEGRDRDGGRGTHVVRVTAYKLFFTGFRYGEGLNGLVLQMHHEWVILTNLFLLLMGFAILSQHFENSRIPDEMPAFLPHGWGGGLALLVIVFVLSSFLDNIAAALIGGTMARHVFRGRVHIGYLAAVVAASNAGGSGSVVGDTTTTMLWIGGVSPLSVVEAYVAAVSGFLIYAIPASLRQHRYSPIAKDAEKFHSGRTNTALP